MIRFREIFELFHLRAGPPYPVRRLPLGEFRPSFSGDGKALYSWRAELSDQFLDWGVKWDDSQSWDSPANRGLVLRSSAFSANVGSLRDMYKSSENGEKLFPETDVMAITGSGTAFGDEKVPPMAWKDISAGAILLVESRASGVPWPAPGDFDIRTMLQTINAEDGTGISGGSPGGFTVLFGDGRVWFLSEEIPFETLKRFFIVADARKLDREKLLGPYMLDRWPREKKRTMGEKKMTDHE